MLGQRVVAMEETRLRVFLDLAVHKLLLKLVQVRLQLNALALRIERRVDRRGVSQGDIHTATALAVIGGQ
jgi:hypothetical protein